MKKLLKLNSSTKYPKYLWFKIIAGEGYPSWIQERETIPDPEWEYLLARHLVF